MVCNKQIGYDSLKSILQHMDANKRYELTQRCPEVRTADKVTPLLIDTMHIWDSRIEINHTTYRLTEIENGFELRIHSELTDDVTIENYISDEPMENLMKCLLRRLLGSRKHAVQVKFLHIHMGKNKSFSEYWPSDLKKLRVQNLRYSDLLLDIAHEFIDFENFPLNYIEARRTSNLDLPIIKTSRSLGLIGYTPLYCLNRVSHQRIHLEAFTRWNLSNFIGICRNRSIGFHCTVSYLIEEDVEKFEMEMESREDVEIEEVNGRNTFTFDLTDNSELLMYFKKVDEENCQLYKKGWILHSKVQEKKKEV